MGIDQGRVEKILLIVADIARASACACSSFAAYSSISPFGRPARSTEGRSTSAPGPRPAVHGVAHEEGWTSRCPSRSPLRTRTSRSSRQDWHAGLDAVGVRKALELVLVASAGKAEPLDDVHLARMQDVQREAAGLVDQVVAEVELVMKTPTPPGGCRARSRPGSRRPNHAVPLLVPARGDRDDGEVNVRSSWYVSSGVMP